MTPTLVAPSLLSANFANLGQGLQTIEDAGGDWVHLDVMDGTFVPQITFGAKMVRDLRRLSRKPFDVHLMVEHPDTFVAAFAEAGADNITIHAEAVVHLHRSLSAIRETGTKAGVAIVPSTPAGAVFEVLDLVDLVLVMTVNPGYGGQELIEATLRKVSQLREQRERHRFSFLLEVDGGINPETASRARTAGADVLVTGSSFFSAPAPGDYVRALKAPL